MKGAAIFCNIGICEQSKATEAILSHSICSASFLYRCKHTTVYITDANSQLYTFDVVSTESKLQLQRPQVLCCISFRVFTSCCLDVTHLFLLLVLLVGM